MVQQQRPNEDSPVMNETLSVIDEHITDMNLPRSSIHEEDQRPVTADSASEYSSHIDQRLSYIAGHETDEEEQGSLTEQEVAKWSPSQVAEHLEDIGVEYKHCETFKEQEISGEVLLAMDQASIFMKEFNLGLVGQRLRTWHKIKALQDQIREVTRAQQKVRSPYLDSSVTQQTSVSTPKSLAGPEMSPHISRQSIAEHLTSHLDSPSPQPSPAPTQHRMSIQRQNAASTPPFGLRSGTDSPSRPSAASIRDFNHSRRHSTADFHSTTSPVTPTEQPPPLPFSKSQTASPHRKTPSLDRNWTMGAYPLANGRPQSAINLNEKPGDRATIDPTTSPPVPSHKFSQSRDLDRGYVSGGETDLRKSRNVLRKRETMSASHSRQSSYQGTRRHSRFGSVDSIKDTVAAMAAPATKLPGIKSHFRNSSATETIRTTSTGNDVTSPTVTRLEYDTKRPSMKVATSVPGYRSGPSTGNSPKSSAGGTKSKPRVGLRAISDAVTGNERASVTSPVSVSSPLNDSSRQSPARTGSTTPSGASQNQDRESTDVSSKGTGGAHTGLTPTSVTRRKSKKETSAYVRGLEQKSPQEQMIGCDYSGWMKKKSSNLMTNWKPRLFVLRGRRLSYYYSEDDTSEKGLIDISSHRVLPADTDIITGIHATVTGARSSPVSPVTSHTPTMASKEAAAQPESTIQKPSADATFIFKLVPPRSGLSRAVNFTKPTIHYFAVDNIRHGRLWMAALMKATIDRDETQPIKTTYQQKTISLTKARAMRHRPPALMGLDEKHENRDAGARSDETGLAIQGLNLEEEEEPQSNKELDHKRTGSLDVTASSTTDPLERSEAPAPA